MSTAARDAYVVEGLALADEIRDAVMSPPDEALLKLSDLLERERTADKRLSRVRMLAGQRAKEVHGSQVEVARRIGKSPQWVNRVITGNRFRPAKVSG